MYAGQIVEKADRETFFSDPLHPYSQKLFDSLPDLSKRGEVLDVIQGTVPSLNQVFTGCRFEPRCQRAWSLCRHNEPSWSTRGTEKCFVIFTVPAPTRMWSHPTRETGGGQAG